MEKMDPHQAPGLAKPELDPNMCRVSKLMEVLQKLQDSERKNEELLAQIVALKEQVSENATLRIAAAENRALKELTAHNKDLMNQVAEKVAENAALREGVVVYSMMSKELKQQLFNTTSELWQARDESKSKYAALLEVNETLKRQLRTATLQLCQIRKKMHQRQRREAEGATGAEVEKELEDLKIQIREMGEEMKSSYFKDKVLVQQTENMRNQILKLEEKMSGLQDDSLKKEVQLEEGIKLLNRQITDLQELVMRTDSDMSEFEKVKLELRKQKKLEKEDHLQSEEEKEFSAFAAEIEALKEQVSEKEAEILYRDIWIQTFRNNLSFSRSALHQIIEEKKDLAETTSATHTQVEREIEDLKTVVNGEDDVPLQTHENLENGWEEHHEGPQETCEEEEESHVQKTEELKNQIKELEDEISALQEDSLLKESNLQEEVQLLNQFQELVFRTDEYKVELEQVKQELEEKRKQETEKQLEREKKEQEMSALAAECGALKEQLSKREEELTYQDAWIQTFRKDLSLSNSTLHQLIDERKHLVETTRQTEVGRTIEDLKEMLKEQPLSAGLQQQQQEDLILENGRGLNGEEISQEEMTRSSFLDDMVQQTEDVKIPTTESKEKRSDLEEDPLAGESLLEEGVRLLNQQIVELQELVLISESDVPEFQKVKLDPTEKIQLEMKEHFESQVEKELSALAEEIEALKEQVSEKDAEIIHRDVWIEAFRSNLKSSNSTLHQLLEERKNLVEEESARQTEMEREIEDLKTGTMDDEEEFLLSLQVQHQEIPVLENGWEVTSSEVLRDISEEEMRSNSLKEESNLVQQTEDLKNQIRELEEELSARQEDSQRRESKLEEEVQLLNQQNMDLQELVCRAGEEMVDLEKVKLELEEKKKQETEISTLAEEIEKLREKLSKKEEEIKYQDAWIQSLRKDLSLSNSALNQLVQTARQAEMEKVIENLRTMVREEEEDRLRPYQKNGWKLNSEGLQEILEQEISCSLLKDKVQQTGNLRNQIKKLEEMSPLRKESRLEDGVKLLNQQIMELQELKRRADDYKGELEAVKLELEEKKKQEMEEQLERERKEEEMLALVAEIEALREQLSKREEELNDQDAWIQTFRKNLSFSNSTLHQLIEEKKHLEETTRQTETEKTMEDLTGEVEEEILSADLQEQHQEDLILENGCKLTCEGPQDTSEEMRSRVPKEDLSLQQTMDLKNQIRELEEEMSALQEDSLRRESKLEEEVILLNQQIMELQELVFMADEYKAELERVKTELEEGKKKQKKEEQLEVEGKEDLLSALAAEIEALKEQVSEKETEIEYQDVWIKTFQKNLNLCSETLRQLMSEKKHLVETASSRQTEMKREIEVLKMMLREEGQIPQHQEDQEETRGTTVQTLDREVHPLTYTDCRFGKTGPPPAPDPAPDPATRPKEKEPLRRKIQELRQKMDKKMEEQERKRLERERKKEERDGNQALVIVAPSFALCNAT